ncbi:hypothetical protein FAIPA1_50115 [Frankia sp. AiPs1]|uniref:tyrosine-type recombinase/integrase n=1 Tax=Frankia sp. AiPa1 TaxID=573492 RepID=UPI0035A998F5
MAAVHGSGPPASHCAALSARRGSLRIHGKGDQVRLVPIHPPLRAAFTGWLSERADWPGAEGPALFLNQRGGRLSTASAHTIITTIAAAAGLDEKTTAHTLRHQPRTRRHRPRHRRRTPRPHPPRNRPDLHQPTESDRATAQHHHPGAQASTPHTHRETRRKIIRVCGGDTFLTDTPCCGSRTGPGPT